MFWGMYKRAEERMICPVVAIVHGYETITDTLPCCMLCFICTSTIQSCRFAKATFSTITFTPRIPAQDLLGADFTVY